MPKDISDDSQEIEPNNIFTPNNTANNHAVKFTHAEYTEFLSYLVSEELKGTNLINSITPEETGDNNRFELTKADWLK